MPKTSKEARQRALASLAELTPEEKAAVDAGIRQDPDNPELTDTEFAAMRPHQDTEVGARRTRGAQKTPTKHLVSLRLDRDVVERFKAGGPGWQVRINEALRKATGL